jgi:FlaG/FlaF family flagellin (archaellin)
MSTMSEDRGVAHVLGVILMAGFAITVAATVAVAGAAMFTESQSGIETAQVESSFSSLAADASELEDNESVAFDLGTADGELEVTDGSHLKIYHEKNDNETLVYENDINSLEYTNENGDTVAYQGGGVFRQRGSGSSLVSAPDFYYRDNALSFPIQKVDGDISNSGTLSGELALEREDRHYPTDDANKSNPLSGGTVYVEMESEYCQGWEEYFDQQTRGSISEGCGEDHTTGDENTVQVELNVPFELDEGTFSEGVVTGTMNDDGKAGFDYEEGGTAGPSPDSLLDNKLAECEDGWESNSFDGDIEEAGLHCFEEMDGSHNINTTAAGGDIEIYVNGTVTPQSGGLPVTGDSGNVTFYIQDGLDLTEGIGNNEVVGNESNPEQTRMYISSDGYVFSKLDEDNEGDNIKGTVAALIYAPESDAWLQSSGNSVIEGSIVVGEVHIQSNMEDGDVNHTASAEDLSLSYEGAGPEFYYLHVTERTVTASS